MKMRTSWIPVGSTLALLFLSGSLAHATLLTPGSTITSSFDPFVGPPGTLLASKTESFVSVLGATDFSGSETEAVYRDSGTGDLDFIYQFTNNSTSTKGIETSTDGGYKGFTTDIFHELGASFGPFTVGTISASSATRSVDGSNVGFNYEGGTIGVPPGDTTAIRMIKTNATNFGPGTAAFINQGTMTLTDLFAPLPTVPEPRNYGLLVFAMGLLFVAARNRKAQSQ
jgi:hypothetical protein